MGWGYKNFGKVICFACIEKENSESSQQLYNFLLLSFIWFEVCFQSSYLDKRITIKTANSDQVYILFSFHSCENHWCWP